MPSTGKKTEKYKINNNHHHSAIPLPVSDNVQNVQEKSLNLEQATFKQAQERRKKKAQEKCEQQNLQYASISAKIDKLEHRLTEKENESLNKVVYASKNGGRVTSQSSQQGIPMSMSMDRIELERKNLQSNITQKLEHI